MTRSSQSLRYLYSQLQAPKLPPLNLAGSKLNFRCTRNYVSVESTKEGDTSDLQVPQSSRLNPPPEDYARTIFTDKCRLTIASGSGGHGCVSFLREKFIAAGPANGGDGGSGGNIYLQAVRGETSLHKLARRGVFRASRGKNGQGKGKGGQRGEDVLLQLPVGTVIREISREDPAMEEEENADAAEQADNNIQGQWRRDKWVLYPSSIPSDYANTEFPPIPRPRRSNLLQAQPVTPIDLDLSKPMEKPMLLAAGAAGGLGNPHFATKTIPRPKFASKGGRGVTITLELELKLLADVGFVGLPNAGKSTLLRALSNSRTRIGDWAFTTLQPSIGTVVLDNHKGRPLLDVGRANGGARTQFSVADIPGLIPDAHLDRGLGLGFLRHVERAQVLALVIDLSTGDAIHALQNLWRELGAFERLRDREINEQTESRIVDWRAFGNPASRVIPDNKAISTGTSDLIESASASRTLPALQSRPISTKPWFVVATKADIAGTQTNFGQLKGYLEALSSGTLEHPSGQKNGWKGRVATFPVSAIRGEGVDRIPEWIVNLLDS